MAVPDGCLLTPRQFEIVQLLGDGLAPKHIAARLRIGRSTVRTHIEHANRALGTGSAAALVTEAGRRGWLGWVEPEDLTPVAVQHPWLGAYLAEFDTWLGSGMSDGEARKRMSLALVGHRAQRRCSA